MLGRQHQGRARAHLDIPVEQRRQRLDAGSLAEQLAGHHLGAHALAFHHRLRVQPVMDETGIGLLVLLGQPHPDLQATEPLISLPAFGRRALRVHDAPARRHPVHLARQDGLRMPRAIAMHHRPFVQICDRGQPDMRMRPHIDAAASPEFDRPHMIQEHERPDGALLRRRQRPPNLESAQIAAARHHHRFNLARAVIRQGRHGHFSQLNPATAFHLSNTRHPSIVARPPHRGRTDPAPPVRSGALKEARSARGPSTSSQTPALRRPCRSTASRRPHR